MRKHTRTAGRVQRFPGSTRALVAAVLFLAGVITLIHACGGDDLVFPGNVPSTPTSQNTATPVPDT
jgi:hypothetical protein